MAYRIASVPITLNDLWSFHLLQTFSDAILRTVSRLHVHDVSLHVHVPPALAICVVNSDH